MQVLIRTDSSRLIGSGHIMRCLVLADLLKQKGHRVRFLCRDLPGNCYDIITERSHIYHLLSFSAQEKETYARHLSGNNYLTWLGVTQEQDASDTLAYIKQYPTDLLISDIYGLDAYWEGKVLPFIQKLMVIDDLANRYHTCNILLDHNYYQNLNSRYKNLVPSYCKKLLGPKYALINPLLLNVKKTRLSLKKNKATEIKKILIFLGGVDLKNQTALVLQQLLQTPFKRCILDVVLGKSNPHIKQLIYQYSKVSNIQFHIQPSYYFDLMAEADLSISGGGVSILERLFIGLPSIMICTAENQKQICTDLHEDKLATYVENEKNLARAMHTISSNLLEYDVFNGDTDYLPTDELYNELSYS